MPFPSLVGGVPSASDFVPSLIFAIAYGCLLPLVIYRFFDRQSRTTILIGSSTFTIERIVAFSFRAIQARDENRRFSEGLAAYLQSTFASGYIGIALNLNNFLRALLVISTFGSETYVQSAVAEAHRKRPQHCEAEDGNVPDERKLPGMPPAGTLDHPKYRFWIRRGSDVLGLMFIVSLVIGVIAAADTRSAIKDQARADRDMRLRYVSSALALYGILRAAVTSLWAYFRLSRVNKTGCIVHIILSLFVATVAIYRLVVMHNTMDSLQSVAPGSLNSPGDKVAFYVFHMLPEWICTMLLFVLNARRLFSTGPVGDWRWRDETEEELAKKGDKKRSPVRS